MSAVIASFYKPAQVFNYLLWLQSIYWMQDKKRKLCTYLLIIYFICYEIMLHHSQYYIINIFNIFNIFIAIINFITRTFHPIFFILCIFLKYRFGIDAASIAFTCLRYWKKKVKHSQYKKNIVTKQSDKKMLFCRNMHEIFLFCQWIFFILLKTFYQILVY